MTFINGCDRLPSATADFRIPLDSFVALTIPEEQTDERDNGLLQAWEILEHVRPDADLVVLSACETVVGKEQGHEGLIGLTRAFQYAGARTVASTLWRVVDQTTAELMIRFYRHLRDGKGQGCGSAGGADRADPWAD